MEPAVIPDWTDGLSVIAPTARTVGEVSFPHFFLSPSTFPFLFMWSVLSFSVNIFAKFFLPSSLTFIHFFFFQLDMRMSTNDSSLWQLDSPHKYLLCSSVTLFSMRPVIQVRAMRLSFVGELGWELHIPKDSCVPVYRAVMAAGAKHGIINSGYRAIDSLSIEKGNVNNLTYSAEIMIFSHHLFCYKVGFRRGGVDAHKSVFTI